MSSIKLIVTGSGGTTDITQLCQSITWSGDYNACARSLEFNMTVSPSDPYVPAVDVEPGDMVQLFEGSELFQGYVFSRQKSTGDNALVVRCVDRGVYLNRNQLSVKYEDTTPEAIAADVCSKLGIPTGELAATGVTISRNFLSGYSAYRIIITAYSLASAENDKKYIAFFKGGKFCVMEKKQDAETLIITGGSNLMSASISESIEKMTNRVQILDKDYKVLDTVEDGSAVSTYGAMTEILLDSDTAVTQAACKIADSGLTQKLTVENLGDSRSIAGKMVAVYESFTGMWGLYYIDSDTHTWKNGQHYSKLIINFKNIMDSDQVGQLIETSSYTASSSTTANSEDDSSTALWLAEYEPIINNIED